MIPETKRLLLREMNPEDFDALLLVLGDPETMWPYDCVCLGLDGPVNWGHCGISLGDGKIIHAWDTVRIDDYREIEAMTTLSGDHPQYTGWVPVGRVLMQNEDMCRELS